MAEAQTTEEVKTGSETTSTDTSGSEKSESSNVLSDISLGGENQTGEKAETKAETKSETTDNKSSREDSVSVRTEHKETPEEVRRLTAERDRMSEYAKDLLKNVLPFVEVDNSGRVIGPRKAEQPKEQEKVDINELLQAASNGDARAQQTLLWISKEQAKREAIETMRNEWQTNQAQSSLATAVREEFPDLTKQDPQTKQVVMTPLLKETIAIMNANSHLDARNPRDIRVAAIEAERNIMKRGLPEFERRAKESALRKNKETGGQSTAVNTGTSTAEDFSKALTPAQHSAFKKEGYDDAAIARLSRMVKQAHKEGGFSL